MHINNKIKLIIILSRRIDHTLTYGILLISLIGIVFFKQASARSDIVHLLPLGLTSVLLAPILLYTLAKELSVTTRQYRILLVLFIVVFGITLYRPISMRIKSFPEKYVVKVINPDIERSKYTPFRDDNVKKVVKYIKDITSENEYIYSGLKNHDKMLFNVADIYFLAARNCGTKYHELNPGFTTLPEIQEENG